MIGPLSVSNSKRMLPESLTPSVHIGLADRTCTCSSRTAALIASFIFNAHAVSTPSGVGLRRGESLSNSTIRALRRAEILAEDSDGCPLSLMSSSSRKCGEYSCFDTQLFADFKQIRIYAQERLK